MAQVRKVWCSLAQEAGRKEGEVTQEADEKYSGVPGEIVC